MAEAASLALPYPETGAVAENTLERQNEVLAASLPERPVVLGGCCCSHVGAVQGLVGRGQRVGVVWLDAHGDLNTPETSPSGNEWGMPLRMLLDAGVVSPEDVALVGARNLDSPEVAFLAQSGIDDSVDRALRGVDSVYVALDLDLLDPGELSVFMPEPAGPTVTEVEAILADVAARARVAGIGATGLLPDESNVPIVARLLAAASF
jgi:arginase